MRSYAVLLLALLGEGCTVPNASHCGNQQGDATCQERGTGQFCSICAAANDGCVADPVEPVCAPEAGITGSSGSGEESTASTSAHTSTDTTGTPTTLDDGTTEPQTSSTTEGGDSTTTGGPSECGNGIAEGEEPCDGRDLRGASCESLQLGTGTLECGPLCDAYDASGCENNTCGNGQVDSEYEQCDGDDLNGASCLAHPDYADGTIGCYPNCLLDYSACAPCTKALMGCQDDDECCSGSCTLSACL